MTFGWHYPPGVTGNEPQIVGWPEPDETPCRCGHPYDVHRRENAVTEDACEACGCEGFDEKYIPYDGYDPDEKYDRMREDRFF